MNKQAALLTAKDPNCVEPEDRCSNVCARSAIHCDRPGIDVDVQRGSRPNLDGIP